MTFGTCRYCGQVVNLDYEEETQAEADIAFLNLPCGAAFSANRSN